MKTNFEIATMVAESYLGLPYIWGGDDPSGFDCSGFCIEILRSVGMLPRTGDWNAQSIWDKFKDKKVSKVTPGCLVFWKSATSETIIHIEFALTDKLTIGASGGGSKTITASDAAKQNAYIKIRPWDSRAHVYGFINLF